MRIIAAFIASLFVSQSTCAGYTSEEIAENSKSSLRAVTSVLETSDSNNKRHYKHIYSRCISNGCLCSDPNGCPQQLGSAYNSAMGSRPANPSIFSLRSDHMNGHNLGNLVPSSGHGNAHTVPKPYQAGIHRPEYIQSVSSNSASPQPPQNVYGYYAQPGVPIPYAHGNGHSDHYSYQGPRGYSIYNHSSKTNSEYTETGTHTGPFQHGDGYGGAFYRPQF